MASMSRKLTSLHLLDVIELPGLVEKLLLLGPLAIVGAWVASVARLGVAELCTYRAPGIQPSIRQLIFLVKRRAPTLWALSF